VFSRNISTNNSDNLRPVTFQYNTELTLGYTRVNDFATGRGSGCVNIPGQQIKVVKTNTTRLEIYFTSQSDMNAYVADFTTAKTSLLNNTNAYNSNNNTIGYYKFIRLDVYNGTFTCGDNPPSADTYLYFHYPATVTSGPSTVYPGFGWQMYITTPQATNNYTCGSCDTCSVATLTIQSNETRNTNINKNVTGYRLFRPFQAIYGLVSNTVPANIQTETNNGDYYIDWAYSNNTYPAYGDTNPPTLIPSMNATTWDWENHTYPDGTRYYQYVYQYKAVVVSWSLPFIIKIQANIIS
jgi:hypothetical protein